MSRSTATPLLALLLCAPALADVPGAEAIQADRLRADVEHLASDALEGRGSGSEGGRKAGDWLAAQLGELGVAGLGDQGSYFQRFQVGELTMRNVIAAIPGSDPSEAVVIGAHYDHLGTGHQAGSLAMGSRGRIHNGADDNASGTAAVLAIARAFQASGVQPRRTVIFAWFDAEERGLLGSKHFVEHMPVDARVVLMINLDMVGRLRGKPLTIHGSNTGDTLRGWLEAANASVGLELDLRETMHSNSDHAPFYGRKVPVLVPFTGLHGDYHRPSDDSPDVDAEGIERVARLCYGVASRAAADDAPIAFSQARDGTGEMVMEQLQAMLGTDRLGERWQSLRKRLGLGEGASGNEWGERLRAFLRGDRGGGDAKPKLGVRIDTSAEGGARIASVDAGSLAEQAGLQAGDLIVGFGDAPIDGFPALRDAVQGARGRVHVEVVRGAEGTRFYVPVDFGGEPEAPPEGKQERWF